MEKGNRPPDRMTPSYRVLVVDDEASVREVLARQIARLGYSCDTAESPAVAVELLRTGDFDVALLDVRMPDTDGLALLSEMKAAHFDVVVVMMSGAGSIGAAVEAMKQDAFDFVEKPLHPELLRSTLERACRHREISRHARQMETVAQQWEATFNAVPDLIAIIDAEHRFVRVNKAMANSLGCAADEAIGRLCYESFHGTHCPVEACPHAMLLADGLEHKTTLFDERLSRHFFVSTSPLLSSAGRLIGSVHVARDMTPQKRIEDELRKANSGVERLLSSMSSFLIEVDSDLAVSRWNAAAERTFGLPACQVLGKPLLSCGISWDRESMASEVQGWLAARRPIRLKELRYARPDGSEGFLGITVNPIHVNESEPAGFFLLGVDITGRLQLEMQLVQAQKLESIGQLAAGIAHEINTPTQYIGDNLEFLQDAFENLNRLCDTCGKVLAAAKSASLTTAAIDDLENKFADANLEYLQKQIPRAIQQSQEGNKRVASIVLAMKQFSHPESAEKTRVDLNAAIASTITVSRNEWKYVADLITEFDAGLSGVNCLPGELNQVILNIIVNAAHAIADVVKDGSEGKGKITVTTRQDGDWAEIRIGDTGTGIPEKVRSRVFDPFFTTKGVGKGTGQGLAIARNVIVDKHGGTLTFETETGKGTTFIIRLPIEGDQDND
jgi:PAS domain S-box-containing protein